MVPIALARSLLFVPGSRPDRFDKAAASGAHAIVLDLEDAVAPADKDGARQAISDWLSGGHPGLVRINAADTAWHGDDLGMLAAFPAAAAMLPKADADSAAATAAALPGRPVVALVETVKGYKELDRLAAIPGVVRIAFGSIDFGTETGIDDIGEAMTAIRIRIVLESCFAGIAPPIDGISVRIDDGEALHRDALRARQFGFGGKLCIHPRQIAVVNAAFRPSDAEQDWARRVIAAIEESGGGATTVDGRMIDKPVVDKARLILSSANRDPG